MLNDRTKPHLDGPHLQRDLHGWYYVGVETESEAHGLVGKKRPGETFIGAKRIKNVEHVKAHELRPVPIGDYWGPLIPE